MKRDTDRRMCTDRGMLSFEHVNQQTETRDCSSTNIDIQEKNKFFTLYYCGHPWEVPVHTLPVTKT